MNDERDTSEPGDERDAVDAGNERDAVARLRAADPAAGLEAREGFADEVVARSMSTESAEPPSAAPVGAGAGDADGARADEGAPVADLAAERTRRRPRWIAVAAVAASLVVVGGVGFAAGAVTNPDSITAGGAAPPISLQGGGQADGSGAGGSAESSAHQEVPAPAPMDASGSGSSAGKMAADASFPYGYGYGRNVFAATGLSDDAGTSTGYAFDPRSASNPETVGALAAALGVEGTPELKDGSWVVGPQDGTAPSVSVGLDGTLGFWFMNPALDPWAECNKLLESATDPAAPVEPCEPAAPDLPNDAAAIDALRALISSVGRDPGAFEYTSDNNYEGAFTRSAQAWPVVDGQRLDQAWSIEVTNAGTYSASGALAPVVALGDYEIVSEQAAFERLSDPRFGAQMTAMPYLAMSGGVAEGDAIASPEPYVPPTEPPATPAKGTAVSWPVNEVEIVDARLGLASQWQPDGSVLVVPAYEFTDANGGTWSVIAVADDELDFSVE